MSIKAQHETETNTTVTPHNDVVSSQEEMDAAIATLHEHKDEWVALPITGRIAILERLIADFAQVTTRWIEASIQAKGTQDSTTFRGEEGGLGAWITLNILRQLHKVLLDIQAHGKPRNPGQPFTRSNGQVAVPVFPFRPLDHLLFPGVKAELWMQPEVTLADMPNEQAVIYQQQQTGEGRVALVLGAGNVASIPPTDVLYKLFVENQVVLLKMNPINAYLGPLLEEGFGALVAPGYLRIAYGGAAEGTYLCQHEGITEIHITGSDRTFEAIVFGPGAEGAQRKAERRPRLHKHVTGELGNVSPVIVVPGPWSTQDIAYQAEQLVSSLVNNGGFNCNATRVIVQHQGWSQRQQLNQAIRHLLSDLPTRVAYYPGAQERLQAFIAAHPEGERFGSTQPPHLPWTFISDVDPEQTDEICFTTEAFCGVFAETALTASSTVEYIQRAVAFANSNLHGTLNATILIHPASLREPTIAAAVEEALENLRYGTIAINHWAGTAFSLGTTTWGAYPGHDIYDIQSGNGVVHNTLMFARPQKSIVRAPFRSPLKPVWFVSQTKLAGTVMPYLLRLEGRVGRRR